MESPAAWPQTTLYISRRILDDIKYSRNADIKRHAVYQEERGLTLPVEEAIIYAIQMISCDAVTQLIELVGRSRVNFRYSDSRGKRFIHHAAESGCPRILRIFLPTGPLNIQDSDGWTPLLRAAERGHADVICILGQESSVNMPKTPKPDLLTALHLAVRGRHCECADALLARGACPDMLGGRGETPLHLAVESACLHCILALLERGADVRHVDVYGQTPLHLAAKRDAPAVADCLLGAGADPRAKDASGRTPLHLAILHEKWPMVDHLLGLDGLDVNSACHQGVRPLHLVVLRSGLALDCARIAVLEKLLSRGAEVDALTEESSETALSLAVSSGAEEMVRILLANGASVSVADKNGGSPLHRANLLTTGSRNAIMAALIACGADVNALDNFGYSPLSKCVFQLMVDRISQADCVEGLRLMVRAGASLGPVRNLQQPQQQQQPQPMAGRQMNSPIVFLAWRGHWKAVVFLIRCGWRLSEDSNLLSVLAAPTGPPVAAAGAADPVRDRLARWVSTWLRNPRSLTHLCRLTVRQQLGDRPGVQAEQKIAHLPLPGTLKSYLLYEPECLHFEDTPMLEEAGWRRGGDGDGDGDGESTDDETYA